ncbi:MAG: hypothetical protein AAGD07_20050, partial [Planctomycetota bacterium]
PDDLSEAEKKLWLKDWVSSEAGLAFEKQRNERFQLSIQNYGARISKDGSFQIDAVPRGLYKLSIQLDERPQKDTFQSANWASIEMPVEIAEREVNLGRIVLEPAQ